MSTIQDDGHERVGMAKDELSVNHARAFGGKWVGVIRTISGTYIDFADLASAKWLIGDIAHGLSMVCRYGGHVAAHYSVAEHSMNVTNQVRRIVGNDEPLLELAALLHDAEEAYIGDMVRPLKHMESMVEFRMVGAAISAQINEAFGVPVEVQNDPRIKQIDGDILAWEMAMIRDSEVRIAPEPLRVRGAFLNRFYTLQDTLTNQHHRG